MVYCTSNLLNMFRALICCCVWLKTLIRNLVYCECIKRLCQIDRKSTILQELLYFKALSNRQLWSCYLLIDTWRNWLELLDICQNQQMHVSVWKYIIHIVYLLHVAATHVAVSHAGVAETCRRHTVCIITNKCTKVCEGIVQLRASVGFDIISKSFVMCLSAGNNFTTADY